MSLPEQVLVTNLKQRKIIVTDGKKLRVDTERLEAFRAKLLKAAA